jgi:integrase
MPRPAKGAYLYLQPERRDAAGRLVERATWAIRDGKAKRRLGISAEECRRADHPRLQEALADYIAARYRPGRIGPRHPAAIPIADVLAVYLTDVASKTARPAETAFRVKRLLLWWGERTLADVGGQSCRAYVRERGAASAARRELEDLRAAINHHRREGLCSEIVEVALPEKPASRERWLTRSEAARLIWAAWRYREIQKGVPTDRRSRRHVARFILVGLYTGTRSAAICGAALEPTPGRGWIDLDRGVFYRRAAGARETKKRQTPVRLPARLVAHLRRWKAEADAGREERPADYVPSVVEWNGRPVTAVKKAFARAVADAGLDRAVTPHTLRHTAITWAMQNGADLWDAASFFGVTVEMLETTYGHHHPDHQESARAAVTRSPGQKPDRNPMNKSGKSPANVIEIARKSAAS